MKQLQTHSTSSMRQHALNWLKSMRVGPVSYRMNAGASANAFTSCFALFILDLLGETENLGAGRRGEWIAYLQARQNQEQGYFEPEEYCHPDKERNRLQLTCFCLSALGILGASPRYPLQYLESFACGEDIQQYLRERKVHHGARGSGNKAMFLGIALSYEYERTGHDRFKQLLDAWFDFHDRYQNAAGFWGEAREDFHYHGFQNALHQLIVYYYWDRPLARQPQMIDAILPLQGADGHFDMTPGGSACMDFDAVHILISALNRTGHRKEATTAALQKALAGLAANQNPDGGFCQSRRKPQGMVDLLRQTPYWLRGGSPSLSLYRLRKSVGVMRRPNQITTGWVPEARQWGQSNLWDTWFRLLAMAEITNSIELSDDLGLGRSRFHRVIGLGHLHYPETNASALLEQRQAVQAVQAV